MVLSEIVNKRPVVILAHGASVNELESRINEFASFDVCWSALGNFVIFERYILSKIHKQLDWIFDCATVPESRYSIYEPIRKTRIYDYLERPINNMWVTSHGMIRDVWDNKSPNKTMLVDSIFPKSLVGYYMNVPNSITLHIATALWAGASAIYIMGLDGYSGELKDGYLSYYQPLEAVKERMLALGSIEDGGINRDSLSFDKRVAPLISEYGELFKNNAPIYNCSIKSMFTVFERITYDMLLKKLSTHGEQQ